MGIPEGWKASKVGSVLLIVNNKRKPINAEERATMRGQYPYYGPTKIQGWINEYNYNGRYAIIGEDGDHFLKYKTANMTQIASGKFNVNNHAHVISGTSKCVIDWFFYYFQNRSIAAFLTRQGAKRYKLNKAALECIPLLVPPLAEQKRIAEILSTWDRAIELSEALLATARSQKRALMQALLTGKRRFSEFEGQDWKEVRLGDVAKLGRGRVISKSEIQKNKGPYPVYSSQTANNGKFGSINTFDFDGEYVTWTTDGVHAGTVSYRLGKFNCTNVCGTICVDPSKAITPFIAHALEPITKKYVSHTLANPKLMNGVMATVVIRIPSIDEQRRISKALTDCGSEIRNYEAQIHHLRTEKRALMQQLLTGKRRVTL